MVPTKPPRISPEVPITPDPTTPADEPVSEAQEKKPVVIEPEVETHEVEPEVIPELIPEVVVPAVEVVKPDVPVPPTPPTPPVQEKTDVADQSERPCPSTVVVAPDAVKHNDEQLQEETGQKLSV